MKCLNELGITDAPWKVVTVNGKLESVESCMGVESPTVCKGMRKNVANARLIAAAPKLYAALLAYVAADEMINFGCPKTYKAGREAIMAAGGADEEDTKRGEKERKKAKKLWRMA